MSTLINTRLGEHRGNRRIYLEGGKLSREGYEPGNRYDLSMEDAKLVLTPNDEGKYTISSKKRNGRLRPIIDISRKELAELFDGVETLRVMVTRGKIVVTAHHQQKKVNERVDRLLSRVKDGEPLRVCSLFHGSGVLDKALHEGLEAGGIASKIGVAVEIDSEYLDCSRQNNPELWDEKSIAIESPIEKVDLSKAPPQQDIVVAGIPCTGASLAGRSRNKLKHAEEHDAAGAMFFSFLEFVKTLNPSIVIGENVPQYSNTASMAVIRSVLSTLGYELQERVLNGNEFGALENRDRLCFVAVSKGLEGCFDIDDVVPRRFKEANINCILEPEENIAEKRWKSFSYLEDKAARDKADGKGFKRQMLDGSESKCGTIGRGYMKARSTEPFLVHKEDNSLSRLFTPKEHARVKAIPEEVVDGLSDTTAHEVLGQSVVYPCFSALGVVLSRSILMSLEAANDHDRSVAIEVEGMNPDSGGTLGGEDFDFSPGKIDMDSGRVRLVGKGWSKGWPIAIGPGRMIRLKANGAEVSATVVGPGPEPKDPLEEIGENDQEHVRKYGDSVYVEMTPELFQAIEGKGDTNAVVAPSVTEPDAQAPDEVIEASCGTEEEQPDLFSDVA
ncbi:DNA cytosine methyltransferase [Halomonas sp. I5-271120]|uniref:DNA cytosine methyltransferase n=1 Tax=Halomonas sp. I5-271120 TaxID=3061632 RepID=UPI002714DC99|nr:DNA cytosine methyltransferase [Halomonas sp. I5-271120]